MKFSSLTCGLLLAMALAGPALAQPAPKSSNYSANDTAAENAEDYMQMHQLEAVFHQGATNHDLNLVMSLFAKNATLADGGKTYTGADQIRRFFESSGPFTHHWVGYTAVFRIAYKLAGNTGHLHFGCLYTDEAGKQVTAHANFDAVVVLQNGKWLFQDVTVTPYRELAAR
jgi:hypothetical protein